MMLKLSLFVLAATTIAVVEPTILLRLFLQRNRYGDLITNGILGGGSTSGLVTGGFAGPSTRNVGAVRRTSVIVDNSIVTSVRGILGSQATYTRSFVGYQIDMIVIQNVIPLIPGTSYVVTAGGVGHSQVTILFRAIPFVSINYRVTVYATKLRRPPPPTPIPGFGSGAGMWPWIHRVIQVLPTGWVPGMPGFAGVAGMLGMGQPQVVPPIPDPYAWGNLFG